MKKRANIYFFSLLAAFVLMITSQTIKAEYACLSKGIQLTSNEDAKKVCPGLCEIAFKDLSLKYHGKWHEKSTHCNRMSACECETESCCDLCQDQASTCRTFCWGDPPIEQPSCLDGCNYELNICNENCGGNCTDEEKDTKTLPTRDSSDDVVPLDLFRSE